MSKKKPGRKPLRIVSNFRGTPITDGSEEPYEVKVLKRMATQLAEPFLDSLAIFTHEHQDELILFEVTQFVVPVDDTMAEFIRSNWLGRHEPMPSAAHWMALAIIICGVTVGRARDDDQGVN